MIIYQYDIVDNKWLALDTQTPRANETPEILVGAIFLVNLTSHGNAVVCLYQMNIHMPHKKGMTIVVL